MLDERAKHLRRQVIEVLRRSGRGHLGPALSIIDILRVLYDDVLRPDDKFILSKGHGCIALYVMLADKGYFPEKHLLPRPHQTQIYCPALSARHTRRGSCHRIV